MHTFWHLVIIIIYELQFLFDVTSSKHVLEQKHNPQIIVVIPFVKLQNYTETTVKQ